MFRRVDDFKTIWQQEADKTLAVFAAIPDAAAHQAVDPQHRDLRRMAWHLVETVLELPQNLGLKVKGPVELGSDGFIAPPPPTMAEIIAAYRAVSDSLLDHLGSWSNTELGRNFTLYGETWTGAFALFVLVTHQTHHRGQMTVLMRQAGLRVPGLYGPAKEDWAGFGMEAPRV
ncbi:DinB family protein [Geothrix sp. 21YS21S-4]|uniref:DinB family protein n=1 Tax=Geothrix sp. 21YS21S-4 TaxID=3068889 RepID=UPI0027B8C663|nr:DinB family protein [Geothrix sp. 21YS21S-4]